MFQNSRLNELLKYFLAHREYTPSSKLTGHFQISERTLRGDVRAVNDELKKYHAQISVKRREGYYLHLEDPSIAAFLEESVKTRDSQLDSVDKRINHLIIKMLYTTDYLSQDDLADEVFVSPYTVINYLKTIRTILSRYELTLQTKANLGYKVLGKESDKRKCIFDLLASTYQQYAFGFSDDQKELLNHVNLERIKTIVIEFNRKYDLHFSDFNLKNLILHIALSISRLQIGQSIPEENFPDFSEANELLHPLIRMMEEEFQVIFGSGEKNYVYSHYVSNTGDLLDPGYNDDYILKLVEDILYYIYESYHIDLRTDMIILNDLSQHLKSILSAEYYNLPKKNPLLNTIRSNYILAYEISETAVSQAFENEPFQLSEDEIGYVALHVGAAIERYFDSRYVCRKKVLIVYKNGYAEGSFLASKLNTLFKDALNIVGKYPSNELTPSVCQEADLIISTTALKEIPQIPIVVIDIPLLKKDIENLSRAITREKEHPIRQIADLFSPNLFLRSSARSRDEMIHSLCCLLQEDGGVKDDFEKSVLEREQRISTAMDGVIALPHPMSICSTKTRIAVGILEKPVPWSEKDQAQIVLMLSLSDDKRKDLKKLYDTFVAITNNPPLQNLLLEAKTIYDFLQILEDHIPADDY